MSSFLVDAFWHESLSTTAHVVREKENEMTTVGLASLGSKRDALMKSSLLRLLVFVWMVLGTTVSAGNNLRSKAKGSVSLNSTSSSVALYEFQAKLADKLSHLAGSKVLVVS